MKDFDAVPDDIWISIFENVTDPWQLAQIVKSCRRFRVLATKPLLRDLQWTRDSTATQNVEHWKTVYKDLTSLPRTLVVGLDYGPKQNGSGFEARGFEFRTYDKIHHQIPSFTMLQELVFKDTTFSPIAYSVIASLPNLTHLSITDCLFVPLNRYWAHLPLLGSVTTINNDFSSLPLTHLTVSNNRIPPDLPLGDYIPEHPLHLSTAGNLRSLSVTWSSNTAFVYNSSKWKLQKLQELEVVVATLSRDLVDSLITFVKNCTAHPRLKLKVDRHNMPDSQMNGVHFPLRGVNILEGPLSIVSMLSGTNDMEHVTVNEAMDLSPLLNGLERLSTNLRSLDIQIRKWDIEILFAVRQLFRNLQTLSIRYGRGVLPENFMIILGSDILPDLQSLRDIKVILDPSCAAHPNNVNGRVASHINLFTFTNEDDSINIETYYSDSHTPSMEYSDLKDYLVGWNRYCPNLRTVQLTPQGAWHRRFQGDDWVENVTNV